MLSPLATSVADVADRAAGLIVVFSGVLAGVARSIAVLIGASDVRVERTTAVGFLLGAAIALPILMTSG